MFELFDFCKKMEIIPMCTPWDDTSFDLLESYGMHFYKTASADLTNHELLKKIGLTGKKMFVSTGMSNESEIIETNDLLKRIKADYVLMHCNSTYPTPFKDVNLKYLNRLRDISNRNVGYSGHERGIHIPIAAVALGATVIEKHITISKTMIGNDHKVSLLPDEFKEMVDGIRQTEQAIGNQNSRECSPGELINRESLSKSIVAKRLIKKGETITRQCLDVKSPGRGLQPNTIPNIVGKAAKRDIEQGHFLYEFDIRETIKSRNYNIPYDIDDLFKCQKYDTDITAHAPDLFKNDHLIDLPSENDEYRNTSIDNLLKVIDVTKRLRKYFNVTDKTKIISSVGGFTRDEWMSDSKKKQSYQRVAESLEKLSDNETEIIIQTVPPFPWYFGGQLLLNLFTLPEEINNFCEENNRKICLDLSHSKLTCNHFHIDFKEFFDTVRNHVSHVHVADASGVDKEGLQLGCGEINFNDILPKLNKTNTIMPEIWQGHQNFGEKCWIALNEIEQIYSKKGIEK
jgi:N-acetylneuraminate synthase